MRTERFNQSWLRIGLWTVGILGAFGGCGGAPSLEGLSQESTTDTVTASTPTLSYYTWGQTVIATYYITSSAGKSESGSSLLWQRADDSSGTMNLSTVATSRVLTMNAADYSEKYIQFCVTPSDGTATGSQTCSGWSHVGRFLQLYSDITLGGTEVDIDYTRQGSGNCFNLTNYAFNDVLSSFKILAPSNNSVTLTLYADIDCPSGGTSTEYTYSAGTTGEVDNVGTTWNDTISSVKMTWGSGSSSSNVSVTVSGITATASGTSGTVSWYRASDAAGTGSSLIATNTGTYDLTKDDDNEFLQVCSGSTCSSWTWVGHVITLYKDDSLSGDNISIAYELAGTPHCFNLTDYNFNDVTSSYKAYGRSAGNTSVEDYVKVDCSSEMDYDNVPANGSFYWSQSYGLNDNDKISSVKAYWVQ
jgi:hypothetical protein